MTRRDFYRYGSIVLDGLIKLVIAVPAVAFLVSPLREKRQDAGENDFETLTSLSQLTVGVPRSFAIIKDRTDAWVRYPSEPVGSAWLIRQPAGAKPEVIAYSAECPHLGCAINLAADGKSFLCPCHASAFDFEGQRQNDVPPRPMDRLDVELTADPDPKVRVKFQQFRTLAEERIPLV
jgi:menaquinol-cytochrome c reductase iron-sulfur subunit